MLWLGLLGAWCLTVVGGFVFGRRCGEHERAWQLTQIDSLIDVLRRNYAVDDQFRQLVGPAPAQPAAPTH